MELHATSRRRALSGLAVLALAVALGLTALPGPTVAEGQGRYQTLAAKWWAWAGGIPTPTNPVVDETGAFCADGQRGNTWFLAGNFGGTTTRTCTIPEGTKLFFPVVNNVCAELPGTVKPQRAKLLACASELIDQFDPEQDLTATVDGEPVQVVRAHSAVFPLKLPADNIFGAPAGHYQEVTDGYWVLLDPLSPGEHTVFFAAEGPFSLEVTYHLTVA